MSDNYPYNYIFFILYIKIYFNLINDRTKRSLSLNIWALTFLNVIQRDIYIHYLNEK